MRRGARRHARFRRPLWLSGIAQRLNGGPVGRLTVNILGSFIIGADGERQARRIFRHDDGTQR
jgi:fluoride ion exporter CrcB/FEX